jgi:hypothetical protein
MKHTPTPWTISKNHCAFRGKPGYLIGDTEIEEDTAHIVKCVNLHDELVAALEDFSIEDCPSCSGTGREYPDDDKEACHRCGGAGEVIRGGWPADIKSVLAKAKGEV